MVTWKEQIDLELGHFKSHDQGYTFNANGNSFIVNEENDTSSGALFAVLVPIFIIIACCAFCIACYRCCCKRSRPGVIIVASETTSPPANKYVTTTEPQQPRPAAGGQAMVAVPSPPVQKPYPVQQSATLVPVVAPVNPGTYPAPQQTYPQQMPMPSDAGTSNNFYGFNTGNQTSPPPSYSDSCDPSMNKSLPYNPYYQEEKKEGQGPEKSKNMSGYEPTAPSAPDYFN